MKVINKSYIEWPFIQQLPGKRWFIPICWLLFYSYYNVSLLYLSTSSGQRGAIEIVMKFSRRDDNSPPVRKTHKSIFLFCCTNKAIARFKNILSSRHGQHQILCTHVPGWIMERTDSYSLTITFLKAINSRTLPLNHSNPLW